MVSDDYFATVGVRVTSGRVFGRQDTLGTLPVALVNEAAARRFWGTITPGERRLRRQGNPDEWTQIVGVVENSTVSSLDEGPTPMLFYPVRQSPASGYVLVRTDGDPSALLPGLRGALQAVGPNLPLSALGTLSSRLAGSLARPTIASRMLGAFSLLAMLLASLGLYGVVSFSVSRRSPEMGIRIAMGAERAQLIQMVMREVLLTVTVGLAMGIGFAMLTAHRPWGRCSTKCPPLTLPAFCSGPRSSSRSRHWPPTSRLGARQV